MTAGYNTRISVMVELDSTEAGFRQALIDDPKDWTTRLIFADWLEDQDRHIEANGQRWQAGSRKSPYAASTTWDWWDETRILRMEDDESDLSDDIFVRLAGNSWYGRNSREEGARAKEYPSLQLAEADLARVLHELGIKI